ncbi:methyl-accepting chemotaxis protein [Asaia bogorensis]|uniref:methyl-accepting chemotaxis protein n=1 Tax=Asaia bogorensis TaxID=91915 RepID=UPI000EFC2FB4|nr:methyl-accepting chemotaxis protein [Asaia bogorensis]
MKTWLYREASFRSKIGTVMLCSEILLAAIVLGEVAAFLAGALTSVAFSFLLPLTLITAAAVFAGWQILNQTISAPVEAILNMGEALLRGDTRTRTRYTGFRDDSGSLVALLERLHNQTHDDADRAAAHKHMSEEIEELKRTAANRQKSVASGAETLVSALRTVAQGNLDCRIPAEAAEGEFAPIREAFNEACQSWKHILQTMAKSSEFITTGAAEISTASDDLARRTERQAENLGQAAASVRTISNGIQTTADVCSDSSLETKKTLDKVKLATEIMADANAAMVGIQKSSTAISEIISVIDGITFQTNVLALNAGVEAARAGDAGRGFAVVAQEVRSLAEKSAKSANEIKRLISVSAEQVDKGVTLVQRTSEYLSDFSESVSNIAQRIDGLTVTTRDQAARLVEVTTSINEMDQVTQQNAAMVEEATAASHNLSAETRTLSETLGRFHVDTNAKPKTSPPRPPMARPPVVKPAVTTRTAVVPPVVKNPAQPPSPAPAKQAAVPRPALQVTSSDQGWEDF